MATFLSHSHLYTSSTDMSPQDAASKLKKKAKAQLSRSKPEPERREVGNGGVGQASLHLQPKPHIGAIKGGGDADPRVGEPNSV